MNRQRAIALPTRINQGDPDAVGLVACFVAVPGGMMDIVRGVVGNRGTYGGSTPTADPTRSTELGTLEAYFDGTNDGYNFGSTLVQSTTAPFSIIWESYLDAHVDAYPTIIVLPTSTVGGELELIYNSDAGGKDVTFGASSGWISGGRGGFPAHITRTAQRHWGVFTFDGVSSTTLSSFQIYVNGEALTMSTAPTFSARGDDTLSIGRNVNNPLLDWNGGIRQVRIYDRAWSQAEAARFFDPRTRDALFAPRSARIYSFGSPASGMSFPLVGSGGLVGLRRGLVA